jgi:hypothetical protein
LKQNTVVGCFGAGFVYLGYDCSNDDNKQNYASNFSYNTAISSTIGLISEELGIPCAAMGFFIGLLLN